MTQPSDTLRQLPKALRFPLNTREILLKSRTLRQELAVRSDLSPVRVAILGGSTTVELKSMLELFLLARGFRPVFYESEFNRFYEDVLFRNQSLWDFRPEIAFIHTTWRNVTEFPRLLESDSDIEERIEREMSRFESLWTKIDSELGALIIQNNFDMPRLRPLGNLEASEPFAQLNFLMRLNGEFAKYARVQPRFRINDIHYLSAQVGIANWFDPAYWYKFRMAVSPTGTIALAHNVASIISGTYGRSKKCLVLDLDNTLWGGVIGDDGVQNLRLGQDHPLGGAYLDFQRYVKQLKERGIILAVCSKNSPEAAKEGFSHPDCLLKLEDFSVFKANWNPKPDNILEIATELNIGLDSLVFVDDNPAERGFVANQLPEVSVPDVGSDVSRYAEILEHERYFEVPRIVQEDLGRASYYTSNAKRNSHEARFTDHGEFLSSLNMVAEIGPFSPVYMERITQLINKTNQFNLTTKRYTRAEVDAVANARDYITLCGRLTDKFGDNGLVSVIIGHAVQEKLEIDLWLMSCRVLNRELESAMFDALVDQCRSRGIAKIVGVYIPTKKNAMVADHYSRLGFKPASRSNDSQLWHYDTARHCAPTTRHILRCGTAPLTSITGK